MPRLMSFSKTVDQIRNKTKTVTRRDSEWWDDVLEPGTLLTAVSKSPFAGDGYEELVTIKVVDVRREKVRDVLKHDRECDLCGGKGSVLNEKICGECDGDGESAQMCANCIGSGCWYCNIDPVSPEGWLVDTCDKCGGRGGRQVVSECPARGCYQGSTNDETTKEGFPGMPGGHFVEFFEHELGAGPDDEITRIEFRYVDDGGDQ